MAPKRKKGDDPDAEGRVIRGRLERDDANSHKVINGSDAAGGSRGTRDCASCHKHFPSAEAYQAHYLLKKINITARAVPVKEITKFKHIMLCPMADCCFSSTSKGAHKIHLRTHGIPWPSPDEALTVIDIGSRHVQKDATLSAFQCRICCAVMSTETGLRKHQNTCRGKYLYTCSYCSTTFKERDVYTKHLEDSHFPDNDFEITGVFVGRKQKIDRKRGTKSIASTERSIVMLTPGITAVSEIFTEAVNSGLRRIIEWEIANHGRISSRIVCNSIISKDNGDEVRMICLWLVTCSIFCFLDPNQTLYCRESRCKY